MAATMPRAGHAVLHKDAKSSKSYNVASAWESTAQLNEEQLTVIDKLGQLCSQRPFPAHVVEDQRFAADTAESHSKDSYVGTLEEAVLHNTNQFQRWHSELEAACASEMEEKYKRYADLLNSHLKSCEGILGQVDRTLEVFDTLLAQHRDVSLKSRALYNSCEKLVKEKESLAEFAEAIRTKLKFFDEFENVQTAFQKAQLSLDNGDQFLALLRKLDECLAYVAANPHYADAGAYTAKFRQLQARALGAVRNKVQQVLKHAVQQVHAVIQESGPKPAGGAPAAGQAQAVPVLAEGAEVSLLYVRFRAAAEPGLKGLLKDIESRANRAEYSRLLEECVSLYAQARQQLVSPFLAQRLHAEQRSAGSSSAGGAQGQGAAATSNGSAAPAWQAGASAAGGQETLPAFMRAGCEHLLRVCQLEGQLFEQFFPSLGKNGSVEHLATLTEPLCTLLYDALRPAVITLQDLDELCELVDILKHEVLGDQIARRGGAAEALRPTLMRTLADVQGRLIFRSQAFIKEEVAAYTPTPADVDYPAKLEQAARQAAAEAAENGTNGAESSNGAAQPRPTDPYALLYPPLRATLLCLSKLYRAVDSGIFGGLAQEAVSACAVSVQQASRQVARKSGPLDAQLFMIKHLLFLREQIAPFDVDFAITDIDLDFTHMRDHMRRIMAGEMSLFTLSSNNAVVRMLGTGGPRVLTYQVDSKKELEKQLKSVCEAFIMAVTKVAVEPMLSFITKVTAVKVAAQAQGGGAAGVRPLREQAFASPAKLAEMVAKVNEAMAGPLPASISKMKAYLANPSTHAILFKPVKSNIAEAHGQVAALLSAEYTPEEMATVPLKQPHELAALLDAMC